MPTPRRSRGTVACTSRRRARSEGFSRIRRDRASARSGSSRYRSVEALKADCSAVQWSSSGGRSANVAAITAPVASCRAKTASSFEEKSRKKLAREIPAASAASPAVVASNPFSANRSSAIMPTSIRVPSRTRARRSSDFPAVPPI